MDELPVEVTQLMTRYRAPPGLARRIRFSLDQQEAESDTAQHAPSRHGVLAGWVRAWWGPVAGFVLGALLSAGVWQYQARDRFSRQFEQQLVAGHVRSLMVGHATDVASSDQHTVKPWFVGKLDFAPVVLDLAAEGFVLKGGRLDYLEGRAVAALVYAHGGHVLNLFEQPEGGAWPSPAGRSTRQGFNLASWQFQGMQYWAVTDASAEDLLRFQSGLTAAVHANLPSH